MKNMLRGVLMSLMLLSCACATQYQWSHPYKSGQSFYADRAECTAMSNSGPQRSGVWQPISNSGIENAGYNLNRGFENMADSQNRTQLFNDCMMGRGWSLVPAK